MRILRAILAATVLMLPLGTHGMASRIKDLVMVAGARENQLVGYGLVVGLAGDGDKDTVYTVQSVANMLQRFGITVPPATLTAKNVCAVIVTAEVPAFVKTGTRIDVTVASFGDAKSLQGGILLQTPLMGADGKAYAVAQGALSVGGFLAGGGGAGGATVQKNHPTVAQITSGALVEREIQTDIVQNKDYIELLLRQPDFTTAARMAAAVNAVFTNSAAALDPTTVRVKMPEGVEHSPVEFVARLEAIELTPDVPARIIINERTGTIVATSRIKISSCAVSHGELTITVAQSLDVSQPNAFSEGGQTAVTPRTDTKAVEKQSTLFTLPEMPSVEKVAAGLNAIGVSPRDMMSIFQAMKQAGALQAELILK